MATTVDALVITLGLDPTQFNEGQRAALDAFKKTQEAAVIGGKNIEAQGKKATEYLSNLKREALTLLAVVAGGKGIVDMTNHIMNLDASTARLARTFGVATEQLSLWQTMIREVGGSNESARGAIGGIQAAVSTAQATGDWSGLMRATAVLSRAGVRPEDWNNPTAILEKLAAFSHSPGMTGPRFAALANMVPGMNQDMINLLSDPRFAELKANALKVTPKDGGLGPASEKMQASLALFSTAVDNFFRVVLDKFVPSVDRLTAMIPSWLKPNGDVDFDKASDDLGRLSKEGLDQISGALIDASTVGIKSSFKDNVPRGIVELLMGPKTADEIYGAGTGTHPAAATKRGGNVFAPGETITGIQVYSDEVGGARGAAATSTVNNRSSRSNSKTDVHIENINLPGVKDAKQFVGSLQDVLSLQAHAAAVDGGGQ